MCTPRLWLNGSFEGYFWLPLKVFLLRHNVVLSLWQCTQGAQLYWQMSLKKRHGARDPSILAVGVDPSPWFVEWSQALLKDVQCGQREASTRPGNCCWAISLPYALIFFINPVWFGGPASLLSVFQFYSIVFFELWLRNAHPEHTYPGSQSEDVCVCGAWFLSHNMWERLEMQQMTQTIIRNTDHSNYSRSFPSQNHIYTISALNSCTFLHHTVHFLWVFF